MGHIEYSPKSSPETGTISIKKKSAANPYNFQDWWSGSKILPNTPSKSGKPQIRRSQSFCVRPDSSPWIKYSKRQQMRRNTTDPLQWNSNDNDNDNFNDNNNDEDDDNMKTISLDNDNDNDNDNDLDDNKHRFHIDIDENLIFRSKKQRKKKRKKNNKTSFNFNDNDNHNNNHNNNHHKLEIDIKEITTSRSTLLHHHNDGESDLSSMDEDPTYDLNQYQSLNSFDLTSINSKYGRENNNMSSTHSQTPSYDYSTYNSSYTFATNQSKSCNDIYSRSAGFIPQSMDHFMCPEFSPLSPNIVHNHSIYSTQTERILHLSPAKNQRKVNTTLQFLNDGNDGNDTDIISDNDEDEDEDDDDDDVVPTPKNIDSNSNSKLKMNKKLKNIDVDMMDKTQNNSDSSSHSLQQTADSKAMLLD